jgi:TonB family protein
VHKIVRVGSNLKAPRQRYSVNPVYPPLARDARIWGTVLVDAVIDEHGNVVQARVLSGHPLLIDAALKAVLQWKYEPTTLNGQPVSVELQFIRSAGVQRMRSTTGIGSRCLRNFLSGENSPFGCEAY